MTDFLVKKLKYFNGKVPYCLSKFGNTSSPSIPLTIVSESSHEISQSNKSSIMCGFGAGLSWGSLYYYFKNCKVSELIEY